MSDTNVANCYFQLNLTDVSIVSGRSDASNKAIPKLCGIFQNIVFFSIYEGWNFNFGNTPLDWIQELLE